MNKIYLSVLLLVLYGCQHAQRTQPPVAAAPVAPSEAAAAPTAAPVAAQPVVVTAQPVAPQSVVTAQPEPEQVVQPASPVAQPAATPSPDSASAAVAEAAAVAKPEVKTEAALSDADGRKLGQKSGCFVCHTVEKKLVGPAWKDIAAKYRGQSDAEAKLITKVAKGGSGAWGATPMPPNAPKVNDHDIKTLVHFILGLK